MLVSAHAFLVSEFLPCSTSYAARRVLFSSIVQFWLPSVYVAPEIVEAAWVIESMLRWYGVIDNRCTAIVG